MTDIAPSVLTCPDCQTANEPASNFCRNCGHGFVVQAPIVSPEANVDVDPPAPFWKQPLVLMVAGAIALMLLLGLLFGRDLLGMKQPEKTVETSNVTTAKVSEDTAWYVVADANVRDKPTAGGSTVTGKIARGTKLDGALEIGLDGKSQWLKLADGSGYIGAVNLSTSEPPKLSKVMNDQKWTASRTIELRAQPDTSSPLLETVESGGLITLAGLTDTGFVEAKLPKGGVGYFLAAGLNLDATGEPITINANPNDCDYGPQIDALFTDLGKSIERKHAALDAKTYASDEEREAAMNATEGETSFAKVNRSFNGLHLTGIAQHYESSSLYFSNSVKDVIAAFRTAGLTVADDGTVSASGDVAVIMSIEATDQSERAYGQASLSCGL